MHGEQALGPSRGEAALMAGDLWLLSSSVMKFKLLRSGSCSRCAGRVRRVSRPRDPSRAAVRGRPGAYGHPLILLTPPSEAARGRGATRPVSGSAGGQTTFCP
ncbi:hypothetical protein AAFF_G00396500 [Aldrovandia affinis]|uniref:Uncharacterized protein n=1 Tax=Aldrovandia affinis TaxID=143900 RepID=A0AAD7WKM8_9TELE|nr:hypothetical protein AAFF_G00396500 [Aldrovandia affinis]